MSGLINHDAELLEQYARTGSDPAFRELVERHLPMVYATALRVAAGDAHLAQDVAQTVFAELARHAASLARVESLGAWLHRVAYNVAAKTIRTENRRRARERTAMEIHEINEISSAAVHWNQLAPVLDEALNQLDPRDRSAIVLRYLQSSDLRSIGAALDLSDDAAQKRIARALEKLRDFLTRRGLTFSAVLLAATLDAGAKTTVPDGLAATIASSSSGHGAAVAGNAAFHIMSTKTKIATVIAILALLAAITITIHFWNNEATNSPPALPLPATVAASQPPATAPLPVAPALKSTPPAVPMPRGNAPLDNDPAPDPTPADLKDAVADFDRLLQAGDIATLVGRYTPAYSEASTETLSRFLSDTTPMGLSKIARVKNAIHLLTNETPTMSNDGNKAIYIDRSIYYAPPIAPQAAATFTPEEIDSIESIPIEFDKKNGQWQIQSYSLGTLINAVDVLAVPPPGYSNPSPPSSPGN